MKAPKCPHLIVFSVTGKAVPLRCGSWYCPVCSKQNARNWATRSAIEFETGSVFVTLTQPETVMSAEFAYGILPKQWDKYRRSIEYEWKYIEPVRYIAFVEGQPRRNDMPHFHVLSNAYPLPSGRQAPKTALSKCAVLCGFGFEVEITYAASKLAAWYVSKYASKANTNIPKGFRRVRASQGFAELPLHPHEDVILPAPSEKLTDYLIRVSEVTDVAIDTLRDRQIELSLSEAERYLMATRPPKAEVINPHEVANK